MITRRAFLGMAAGLATAFVRPGVGAATTEAPAGLYALMPVDSLVIDATSMLSLPFVDGLLVRPRWKTLQPRAKRYRWSQIDEYVEQAAAYGKRVTLGVLSGSDSVPDWVFRRVPSWSNGDGLLANPMDANFHPLWHAFVEALGERYAAEDTIAQVIMTGATGLQGGLRFSALPPGWDADAIVDGWRTTTDVYAAAFPDRFLFFEVATTVGERTSLCDDVLDYTWATHGSRIGPWVDHLSAGGPAAAGNVGRTVTEHGPRSRRSPCGFQFKKPQSSDMDAAYRRGFEEFGARYFEVYRQDLKMLALADVHQAWHNVLVA